MGKDLITASIVTYHNPLDEVKSIIDTFLESDLNSLLIISDNSSNRYLEKICSDKRTIYIHNKANLGFGTAHNIAFNEAIKLNSKYHFILNPDVKFDSSVLEILVSKMGSDSRIGAIMPKVLNFDNSVQYLPKLLPSPSRSLIRLIKPFRRIFRKQYSQYILQNHTNTEVNVPTLSGCFCLYNLLAIKQVGQFDERFFMYFEDNDLSRRIHKEYKTLYFPSVSIYHGYERGAAKNFKLFKIYVSSAFAYYNKYGWFFDKERRQRNREVLCQLN